MRLGRNDAVAPGVTPPRTSPSQRAAGSHFPGFDGVRLFAALSVIFSHAYFVAGSEGDEPFFRLLGPQNILGLYGVFTFFGISGFLLARSLDRDSGIVQFVINRVLRIYPGFIFCVLVTALLIGPAITELPWLRYLERPELAAYVKTALTCMCDMGGLPGVYVSHGADKHLAVVNGSLWSLSFEVLSYLLLAGLWLALRNVRAVGLCLAALTVATIAFPSLIDRGFAGVAYTLPYFAGGVVMYAVYRRFGLDGRIAAGCAVAFLICCFVGIQRQAFAIFGTYLVVYFGTRPNIGSRIAARAGDLSYGIYLFGWPVEQLVKQQTGTTSPALLMALALPLVLAAAAVSCHLVERPALRLKAPLGRLVARAFAIAEARQRRAARLAATLAALTIIAATFGSRTAWWYVTQSVAEIALWSAAAAALAAAVFASFRTMRRRGAG